MKLKNLSDKDIELINDAKILIKKRKNKRSCVAASLRTESNKIFNGINIELKNCAPCSICAEYSAIAKMFSEGENKIESIVAVCLWNKKYSIISPCGQCRQFISAFGNPYIILNVKGKLKKAKLSEISLFQYK
jgi:cytidine deaminase